MILTTNNRNQSITKTKTKMNTLVTPNIFFWSEDINKVDTTYKLIPVQNNSEIIAVLDDSNPESNGFYQKLCKINKHQNDPNYVNGKSHLERIFNAVSLCSKNNKYIRMYCHHSFVEVLVSLVKAFTPFFCQNLTQEEPLIEIAAFPSLNEDSYKLINIKNVFSGFEHIAKMHLIAFDSNVIVLNQYDELLSCGRTIEEAIKNVVNITSFPESLRKYSITPAHYLHSVKDELRVYIKTVNRKIDVFGNYIDFHGMTVVSHVDQTLYSMKGLLEDLNKEFGDQYSILPLESIHMTIFNMFVQPEKYDDKTISSYTNKVKKFKSWAHTYVPHINYRFRVQINACYLANTIGIKVTPERVDSVIAMRSQLKKLTKLEDKTLEHSVNSNPFHITFGYRYTTIKRENDNLRFKTLLENHSLSIGTILTMKPAEVCEFNDMTHFEPIRKIDNEKFNRVRNPFVQGAMLV